MLNHLMVSHLIVSHKAIAKSILAMLKPFAPAETKKSIALWLLGALLYSGFCSAEALLQILPTRVILEDGQRAATLTLVNQGNEDTAYRMFFRNIRMSDTGEFKILTENDDVSEERFADDMLRFSPRRITIPGTGKQTIRIVARKPQGLEDGEYRSHMVFRRLPSQQSILDDDAQQQLKLSIQPIVEVTIPVIVRHGELNADIELSNAEIVDVEGIKVLRVTINRSGNRSIYGDLKVNMKDRNGDMHPLVQARGISVYYPNEKRIFELPIQDAELHETNETDNPATKSARPGLDDASELIISFKENATYGGDEKHAISLAL